MAESTQHAALVNIIIRHIQRNYADVPGLGLLSDLSGPLHCERPNRIEGFVPDVQALDAPLTTMILGEAKTPDDLETSRSIDQITAFLSYLSFQPRPVFILGVSWHDRARAESLVARIKQQLGAHSVRTQTLTDIGM